MSLDRAQASFPPYRVVRELARGGMGVVYEVVDPATGGAYALKTLVQGVDAEALLRFRREVEALGKLDHPHVIKVHTARLDAHPPYLVQALLPGGSLDERLRQGPFSAAEAVDVVCKLAEGVAAAHAVGVLHRDLKPQNVLFDERGEPVLVDFGLARTTRVEPNRLTQTGMIVGTPSYMAPEQVNAPHRVGPAADVYGLGAVLYTLLTGQPPFAGALFNVLQQVLTDDPVPPSRLVTDLPADVEAVVLAALAKEPEGRPDGALALAAALRGEASLAAPRSRSGGKLALAGLALALCVAGGLAATSGGSATARERSLVAADVRTALRTGNYAQVAPLQSEVALLRADGAPGVAELAAQLTLLAGFDAVNMGDFVRARAQLGRLGGDERASLDAVLRALDPQTPCDQGLKLLKDVKLRLPERDLWLARVHGRVLDREADARACQAAFERYERPLREEDAALRDACERALEWHRGLRGLRQAVDAADAAIARERAELPRNVLEGQKNAQAYELTQQAFDTVDLALPAGSPGPALQSLAEPAAHGLVKIAADGIPDLMRFPASASANERCQRLLWLALRLAPDLRLTHAELDPFLRLFSAPVASQGLWEPAARLGEALHVLGEGDRRVGVELGPLTDRFWDPEATRRMLPLCRRSIELASSLEKRHDLQRVLATGLERINEPAELQEAMGIADTLLAEPSTTALVRSQMHELRARIFRRREDTEQALAELDAAIVTHSVRGMPYVMRAEIHAVAGRSGLAVRDARTFLKLWGEETLPEHCVAVAILWEHARSDVQGLARHLQQLLRKRQYPGWRARFALVLLELGRREEAIEQMELAVARLKDPVHAWRMIDQLKNLTPFFERDLEKIRTLDLEEAKQGLTSLVKTLDETRKWYSRPDTVGYNP